MTSRTLAYDLLIRAEAQKQYSNIALDHALNDADLSQKDKRLAAALFYGVIEKRLTLDFQISQLSSRPLEKIDRGLLTALRLGLYQLIFLDKIPPHAAINETVSLCDKRSRGFANAILRAFCREPMLRLPDRRCLPEYLSVAHSVSLPIVQCLIDALGEAETESILQGFDSLPDITLRTNTLRCSRKELANALSQTQDVPPVPTRNSPHGIKIRGNVRELYGFENGLFFVQDEASQICVEVLDPQPEQLTLDICACPGSKSFGAALNMQNKGSVLSFDLHENKLSLVRKSAQRLGIDIITTRAMDGRVPLVELLGKADRVLCDVPCSGLGVLAKKPELRYRDLEGCERLPDIQYAILENACRYLRPNGVLVYSTCTLLPRENGELIERFLKNHSEFSLCPWRVGEICSDGMQTLLPHIHGTDGFFIAKLVRRS